MRFLFCSLSSRGFLYPFVGLGTHLKRRGHDVAFVTGIEFHSFLAGLGFVRIPRGVTDGPSFQVETWGKALSIGVQVKHVEHAVGKFSPDLIVGQQLTLGPLIAAERQDLPVALMGLCTYLLPPAKAKPEDILSQRERRRTARYQSMLDLYNEARGQFRLAGAPADRHSLTGDLFMVRSVSALEVDAELLPDQVRLVGACIWDEPRQDAELEDWLAGYRERGLPVIYVQQGRTFDSENFLPYLVEHLAHKECGVAMSIGRMDGHVGTLPSNCFARPHLPQTRVLAKARAVVSSANTTAVLGALTSGVPAVLIPSGGEQPDVAEVCEAAGIARVVRPVPSRLRLLGSELDKLLADTAMRARCLRVAEAFSAVNSFSVAADYLERPEKAARRGGATTYACTS